MSKPKIAGLKPIATEVVKGEEKYFCTCGESKGQPFCDGSHRTTSFKPLAFTSEKTETAYLCMCKQSKNLPYCDGTHATLKKEANETETTSNSGPFLIPKCHKLVHLYKLHIGFL